MASNAPAESDNVDNDQFHLQYVAIKAKVDKHIADANEAVAILSQDSYP